MLSASDASVNLIIANILLERDKHEVRVALADIDLDQKKEAM